MTEQQTQAGTQEQDSSTIAAAAAAKANQIQQTQIDGKGNGAAETTVAAGGDKTQEQQQAKPYWPEDWRQKAAEHIAAGDKKAYDRELKRLERIADPTGLYGMYRELEGKFTSGGLIKMPGKDAKPEEIAEFQKALGWTDKPEELIGKIKLDNGAVIGDADKPMLSSFLKATHGATSAQEFASKAANWYFGNQEQQAALLDEADEKFKTESERALKDELGPSFRRRINSISSLFDVAPGGADVKNEKSLYARLMGGRTADGRVIGNDPDMVRFLSALALDRNPAATVVEDGDQTGLSIDGEIAAIEKRMRDDRHAYFKDEKAQARYRELVTARDKIQARKTA